jgi:tRNA threonylcarbamoyladenosine biosynthesis protein TsaB
MAAAKGLCFAENLPLYTVSTLEAMAYSLTGFSGDADGAKSPFEGAVIAPCMDARRGEVYCAVFEVQNGAPVRIAEDRAISAEQLLQELCKIGRETAILGDGSGVLLTAMNNSGASLPIAALPPALRRQTAAGVAAAAFGAAAADAVSAQAVYLRKSQAERMKDSI